MSKIVVRINGGLGNQLHCYAFGRAIAHQSKSTLEIDSNSGYWSDPYGRIYLLNNFPHLNVNLYKVPNTSLGKYIFKVGLKLKRLISSILPLKMKILIEEKAPYAYQKEIHYFNYTSFHYFIGYWASPNYYKDIEAELRYELAPPMPENKFAIKMLEKIKSLNSCSIHYRTYEEEVNNGRVSMVEYYKKAVGLVLEKKPEISFFVFSDNIEKAKIQLSGFNVNFNFIDILEAKGNSQSLIDFYLMYSCENAIIGDSTFSWWAAWLSDNSEKCVIAPRGLSPWGDDWLPESWIKVNI